MTIGPVLPNSPQKLHENFTRKNPKKVSFFSTEMLNAQHHILLTSKKI
jgi:hypothetical protein